VISIQVLIFVDILALGITDEVEMLGLKGSKKKKGKKLDEDWVVSSRASCYSVMLTPDWFF
jgi:hypothetical protein